LIVLFDWDGPVARNTTGPSKHFDFGGPVTNAGFFCKRSREAIMPYCANNQSCTMMERTDGDDPFRFHEISMEIECVLVVGQVECWGHVIEHDDGYRSQAQTIRSLEIFVDAPEIVADLERRYQCPVTVGIREE
jgi:hypothetical protein